MCRSAASTFSTAPIDEALEVAAKHPVAAFGVLEVRAFADA
jgi:hypothetical protein